MKCSRGDKPFSSQASCSKAVDVPGAKAPVVNVLALWSSMARPLLRSKTNFATFLHSFLHNEPSAEEGTADQLWPIPAPYPTWLSGEHLQWRQVRRVTRARQMAVNLVVLGLSWLHMGRPKTAPKAMSLRSTLTKAQWVTVKRMEGYFEDLIRVGDVGPAQMGRAAAKMEGLDSLLGELHDVALALAPNGYLERSVFSSNLQSNLLPGHCQGESGTVVGQLRKGAPVLAKSITSSRLSFPENPPQFDPGPLLEEPHFSTYADPLSKSRNPDPGIDRPPRVQVRASLQEAFSLMKFLDSHQRLTLAPPGKIRTSHLCGAFSLTKDIEKDRLIVDARPPNSLEETLTDWCSTLGSIQALSQQELLPGLNMYFSGTDLRDYYYCYKVSKRRSYRNTFALPLKQEFARQLHCYHESLAAHPILYPCLSTMAMGDCQAVEIGQAAHIALGIISRSFSPYELLTAQGRAPRGQLAAGIVIDDAIFCEQLPPQADLSTSAGVERLNQLCEEYLQRGLVPHPKKTFRGEVSAEFWGALVNGASGVCRANPKRLVPLIALTMRITTLGFATVALLEIVAGSWVSVLQVRRRMLCLLDEIYSAQCGRDRSSVVQLSPALREELWLLVVLSPLAVTNMRAESIGELFLSDASERATASVRATVPVVFTRELQRHCLSRGSWSKLLPPWQAWLRSHGDLLADEELPQGVPLVCHPLWKSIAEGCTFKLHHKKMVRSAVHINILELKSILEVEAKLAARRSLFRYCLGADSQVALAAVLKGRSSSPRLNRLLQQSLAVVLGSEAYGNFGFVPSLSNVSDDPTRDVAIRPPLSVKPVWWEAAMVGDFVGLDAWLESIGFSPLRVAGLPFKEGSAVSKEALINELIAPLRKIQKPERLREFDAKMAERAAPFSPLVRQEQIGKQEHSRVAEEPEGQTKKKIQERSEGDNEPRPPEGNNEPRLCHSVGSRVAPPSNSSNRRLDDCDDVAPPEENPLSPLLPEEARRLLSELPPGQFLFNGKRNHKGFLFRRKGFLDLYSGKAGVALQLSRRFKVWVLTFDWEHGHEQDLLSKKVQQLCVLLMKVGAFLGMGAAPECSSFSRAITPAVRDREHLYGRPDVSQRMKAKLEAGNCHALFVLHMVKCCIMMGLAYWVENPDGSFLWLLPPWSQSLLATAEKAYRFDMCRYRTPWRKRTRIATSTYLAGRRELCCGGHSHVVLRGRSSFHRASWTRVAQTYPRALCIRIAEAMGKEAGLVRSAKRPLHSCAHCSHCRIGEAKNPGPNQQKQSQRDPRTLVDAPLVGVQTLALQERIWRDFSSWLDSELSFEAKSQVFLFAPLGVQVVRRYGVHLFSKGKGLYEFRHLLVLLQQRFPLMRPAMQPAWQLVSKWEEVQPVTHRRPLPEVLYKAMFSLAVFWKWTRFAGVLLLGMEGIARVGELLKAYRSDMVLPSDMFECERNLLFLKVRSPKTLRRGKGRVQHLRVESPPAIRALECIFSQLDDFLPLFPGSAAVFRDRWNRLLTALGLPLHLRPTPSGIRGGAAIMAYQRGMAVSEIMWKMRLVSITTLESYIQELAAESLLTTLPDRTKRRIRSSASFFNVALQSLG